MRQLNCLFVVLAAFLIPYSACSQEVDLPGAATPEVPLPRHVCYRAVGALVIDGTLDEPSWDKAVPLSRFLTWDGKEAGDPVDCRMLWDNDNLYFGFRCPDSNVAATYAERDQPLWEEDVVEMFIDPEARLEKYAEIIVNPCNCVFDAYHIANDDRDAPASSFWDWDAKGIRTAVQIRGVLKRPDIEPAVPDSHWTVEVAIPFSTWDLIAGEKMDPPTQGDTWRVAVTRFDGRDAANPEFLHYAWSPPYKQGWPHIVRRMGIVSFSSEPVGSE